MPSSKALRNRLSSLKTLQNEDHLALQGSDVALTGGQLAQMVLHTAQRLKKHGVSKGTRVATSLPAELEFPINLALMYLGAVSFSQPKAMRINKGDYGLEILIALKPNSSWPEQSQIITDRLWLMETAGLTETPEPATLEDRDPCRLVVTSGSTGTPKAILLSIDLVERRLKRDELDRDSSLREFSFVSAAGFYGFRVALEAFLGKTPLLAMSSDSKNFLPDLIKHEVESVTGSPSQLATLLKAFGDHGARFWSLKRLTCVGGRLPKELYQALVRSFGCDVFVRYGATETANISGGNFAGLSDPTSVGTIKADTEVKIVSDDGSELPEGSVGRVRVKNDFLIDSYLSIIGEEIPALQDGWFDTGDLGRLEANRELFITGRSGSVINIGGVKVDLTAIENPIRNLPGISDCLAFLLTEENFGVPRIAVALEVEDDFSFEQAKTLVAQLPREVKLTEVHCVRKFPRSATGKIMREALLEDLGIKKEVTL